ncbi:hypothetical protein E2C01_072850 [Portunus trituberculatus]|uniref:Uncharacterized protein n=1 Tax=Portunus trituberculatus TaxID=210409 RepID=A0A5B7I895_PORTR|nr:hypothetical protein [Portunus trituberculatus]
MDSANLHANLYAGDRPAGVFRLGGGRGVSR